MSLLKVTEDDLIVLKTKLQEALGDGYEIEINKEVSALMGAVRETFDLVIFYHGDALCGIDYRNKVGRLLTLERFQDLYIDRFRKVGLKYAVEYCGENHELYFWTSGSYRFDAFTFDDVIIAIKGNQSCGKRLKPLEVVAEFSTFMTEGFIDEMSGSEIIEIQSLFSEDKLVFDEKSASIWLCQEAEDYLFKILLHQKNRKNDLNHVCRYTSLNSLFLTMKDGNHVMCSITCMNDKGEMSYADKYVGYGAFANSTNAIKEDNDCFILSCCSQDMIDNLTMWRLYGNDGKGVCLEYDVDWSKIDDKAFFLAPVSYGVSMGNHPALDFIRSIRHWRLNGWSFDFKRWYIWKHFFKSYLFREEQEVRLLYIWRDESQDKVEWIMDSTNNIVSRLCKFSIKGGRLPMILSKAIIGPKCPEQGSNVDQFNYMNRQQRTITASLIKPAVKVSTILDYR